MAELAVNLWAIYDASVEVVYALCGKVYALDGTDAEKLAVLKSLSRTDYLTVKRFPVPSRFAIVNADGEERTGVAMLNAVYDENTVIFNELFDVLEADLPALPDFTGAEFIWVNQALPADPVCVVTVLYEDASGQIRPIINDEDRRWVAAQG